MPKPRQIYVVQYKGQQFRFQVDRIARVRSGAVLAFGRRLDNGREMGIPVSKYATWQKTWRR